MAAAAWVLAGALAFSMMNALSRAGAFPGEGGVPVLQVTFFRYAVATLLLLPFVLVRPRRLRARRPSRYLWRTLAGFGGIALMFAAVRQIPLATATAIGFTSPLFAMMIAAAGLREKVTGRRWGTVVIGFTGALIIAAPSDGGFEPGMAIALAAALCMGAEVVSVRWLTETGDDTFTILFYSNLCGSLVAGLASLPQAVTPDFPQIAVLLAVGAVAAFGQLCVIAAARRAEASYMAPFFYVSLIYAALIGLFAYGEFPSPRSLFGGGVILIGAALMLTDRGSKVVSATTGASCDRSNEQNRTGR